MRVNGIIGRLLVAVGLVALLIVPAAYAQNGGPNRGGIPLDVVFVDEGSVTDDVGDPNPITEKLNTGPYSDALENVRAEIYYGNFYLDTNENKGDGGRRVNIMFPEDFCPASGKINGIPCPKGGPQDVYIATKDGADPAQLNQVGAWAEKRLAINWAEGAYSYHLRHNGIVDLRHGSVTFICTAVNGNGCYQWSATPTSGSLGTVGLYANPTKGNVGEVYLGSFYMPFVMTLMKK